MILNINLKATCYSSSILQRPRENRVTCPRSPHKLEVELEILLPWILSLALMAGVGVHKWADMSQIPALPTIYCVTLSKSLTFSVLPFAHLQM